MQGSFLLLRAKQETGKRILSPRETRKQDMSRHLPGGGGKQHSKQGVQGQFPTLSRAVQKAELCCLVDEKKEKSQGENCSLFYPGINSRSSVSLVLLRNRFQLVFILLGAA